MEADARKLESLKFAQESAKQIMTLSTAVVTFVFGAVSLGSLELHDRVLYFVAGIVLLLLLSIGAGIVTLFALSGILSSKDEFEVDNPLGSRNYVAFGRTQFFAFGGAMVLISMLIISWPAKPAKRSIEVSLPSGLTCLRQGTEVKCNIAP